MCPWRGYRKQLKDDGIMDKAVWNSLVPFLKDVKSIDFTGGGEPLLNGNLLDWMQQARHHGCETGFLTNGLLLKPSFSEKLIQINPDWLAISIDGADAVSYERIRRGSNFDELCRNISTLSRLRISDKPWLMINFVIMESNADQLEEMVRLAAGLGVDQINVKQCDVIRSDFGKNLGIYAGEENKSIKRYKNYSNELKNLPEN